jgi:hypothetical protein
LDIVKRVKAIILTPAAEWRAIETESGDTGYLFANYVAILAAIPPVANFIRRVFIGAPGPRFGGHPHFGFFSSLFSAVVHYLAAFVVVYAVAMIIDALAPSFLTRKNQESAMKLAVYSMTPAWLAGVFALVPALGFLRMLGLYSLYVFWLGLPILTRPPPDKTAPYAIATVLCWIVLWIVVTAVIGRGM